jgi:hypothetical protein
LAYWPISMDSPDQWTQLLDVDSGLCMENEATQRNPRIRQDTYWKGISELISLKICEGYCLPWIKPPIIYESDMSKSGDFERRSCSTKERWGYNQNIQCMKVSDGQVAPKKKMQMRQERDNATCCTNLLDWWLPIQI